MERELIPGILPAGASKMEKVGGETGACRRGRVRGNFLRPHLTSAHADRRLAPAQWGGADVASWGPGSGAEPLAF